MKLVNTDIVSLINTTNNNFTKFDVLVFHSISKEFDNATTIEELNIIDYSNDIYIGNN